MDTIVLTGDRVRLEVLDFNHVPALCAAAAEDRSFYTWSFVPDGEAEMVRYVTDARAQLAAGRALPFAVVRTSDGKTIGSTRFFELERWNWPPGHPRAGREFPDAGEIGYSWLAASAIRSGINRENKRLLLTHAFETWGVLRVCFHTDARNERSAGALEGIGARYEGVLHSHRLAVDFRARDSKRYSIVAADWPGVRSRFSALIRGRES
jgi:N-acetyltransferase